ncbi:hypothetical protein K7432_018084 [Basidiobolus ranarum]|uniref:Uncharacterized protein n=1 Tax=Basidiobolus ranarum TaxID=34480 RepID=A0ABR2WCL8_9FUNG
MGDDGMLYIFSAFGLLVAILVIWKVCTCNQAEAQSLSQRQQPVTTTRSGDTWAASPPPYDVAITITPPAFPSSSDDGCRNSGSHHNDHNHRIGYHHDNHHSHDHSHNHDISHSYSSSHNDYDLSPSFDTGTSC